MRAGGGGGGCGGGVAPGWRPASVLPRFIEDCPCLSISSPPGRRSFLRELWNWMVLLAGAARDEPHEPQHDAAATRAGSACIP